MEKTNQIKFQDQSANELIYCLYNGLIAVKDLMILTEKSYNNEQYNIRIGIIGASHFMQLYNSSNTIVVTEVFACKQPNSPNTQKPYFCFPLKECLKKQSILLKNDILLYETKIYSQNWEKGQDSLKKSQSKANILQLAYDFPGYEDACTALFLQKKNNDTVLVTYHCYPNEQKIIKTKTTIKFT